MKTFFDATLAYCANLRRSLGQGWSRFWFTPIAPQTLAMMRVCTGLVLLYVHLTTFHQLLDFVGPNAWIDDQAYGQIKRFHEDMARQNLRSGKVWISPDTYEEEFVERNHDRRLTIYALPFLRDPTAIYAVHSVFVLGMLCFTLGLGTRVAAFLAWFGHLNYIQRGYTIWFGMDSMLMFMTFYLMLAPCGWALSLDRLIARWRAARNAGGGRSALGEPPPPAAHWSATVLTRMIQIHMCIVYFCAGVAKLQGASWWDGTATWFTMNTVEFALVDMRWLGRLPMWVWNTVTTFSTYATLAFEIGFPFLIWVPFWRPILLFGAVGLHFGIGFFMGLFAFSNIMLTACMSFISPEGMKWFVDTLFGGRRDLKFRFSRHDPAALRQAALLKAVDAWSQIEFIELPSDGTGGGALELPDGQRRQGKGVVLAATRRLAALWLTWPAVLLLYPSAGARGSVRHTPLLKGQDQGAKK